MNFIRPVIIPENNINGCSDHGYILLDRATNIWEVTGIIVHMEESILHDGQINMYVGAGVVPCIRDRVTYGVTWGVRYGIE
jgi:hypothetical protein